MSKPSVRKYNMTEHVWLTFSSAYKGYEWDCTNVYIEKGNQGILLFFFRNQILAF